MKRVLLIIQLIVFSVSIGLGFIEKATKGIIVGELVLVTLALVIKVFREARQKKWKLMLKSQLKFYIAYLLVAIEIAFFYTCNLPFTQIQVQTNLFIAILVIRSCCCSFLTQSKLQTIPQGIVYSIGTVIKLALQVKATIQTVILLDTKYRDDYFKDFNLLTTAAGIAASAFILDVIFRPNQQKLAEKQQQSSLQIELKSR